MIGVISRGAAHIEPTRSRTLAWCLAPLSIVIACSLVCGFLPTDSIARAAVSDTTFIVVEIMLVGLCWLAYRRSKGDSYRWLWLLLGIWALGNLLGDSIRTYHELISRDELLSPSPADFGYLASYLIPIALISYFGWKTQGRLHYAENALDSAIFTLGAAGLAWTLVFHQMFADAPRDAAFWVDFTYPLLDLLIISALISLLFGYYGVHKRRPPLLFILVFVAFLFQVAGDSIYFVTVQSKHAYSAGGWIDTLWLLGFSSVAAAAVLAIRARGGTAREPADHARSSQGHLQQALPTWRAVIPYTTLPVMAAALSLQISRQDWQWDLSSTVLATMSAAIVFLLVWRQYVSVVRNRRLYADLADVSLQLENRVTDLAQMNQRLEDLNDRSHRLTSLRQPLAVARAGLQTACEFTGSPGGWISIGTDADYTVLTHGAVEDLPHAEPEIIADAEERGVLRVVPLETRDRTLGTMLLLGGTRDENSADLVPLVAAHLASALDNARRYEEALQLAERDPLTGLFNHRGIHRRLAGEALRTQQSDSQLSLVMIDLDDFKVLNDTYGHVAGDSVLRQVSDAIRAVLRHADLAGRVGGDELLLVLPNTGPEGALQFGERIRTALASRPYLTPEGVSIPVYLSLGVATMPDDAQSVGELIEVADANLYSSKEHGGNRITGAGNLHSTKKELVGGLGVADRLLDAVGARDHYTRRHSEQVMRHAVALGKAVGLPDDSLRTLEIAAMLHDIGNLGVPPELLRRPGPLTPDEETLVRGHVPLGADLIMEIPRLSDVVAAVSAHHERYDGSGYPTQSAGEDIPLLGRILAVADAYSAMTLDRPYRQTMRAEDAREELLKSAGTHFDPELVRAFTELLETCDDECDDDSADEAIAG